MAVIEALTDEECYLMAILQDESGLDLAEFTWYSPEDEETDGCWRAWPFQWSWFRCKDALQIEQSARSVGKSQSIALRAFVFPFVHPGQEMIITAPEKVHLDAITDRIETQLISTRLSREMLVGGRAGIRHTPFHCNLANGSRIMGRIPQRDGRGIKGCVAFSEYIWTSEGLKPASEIVEGDLVLTHTGQYQPVTSVHHDVNDCYEVRGQGSLPMVVSCDHRFYGAANLATRKQARRFGDLYFEDVEHLVKAQFYWATPTRFPELPVPSCKGMETQDDFWWLVGRYLADGVKSAEMADWLACHFGRPDADKRLPGFALGLPESDRQGLLQGYLDGAGRRDERCRWSMGSVSRELALGLRLLGQSLGFTVSLKEGLKGSWCLQMFHGNQVRIDDHLVAMVRSVEPVGRRAVVNIQVEGDHSYLSGSIMSHNTHPIWLELDEAQDYPEPGWTEIIETLKRGTTGAVWRAHGVTRGVRDSFYKFTQPRSGWTVHRYTAMHRPSWSDAERQEKIDAYGSKEHPDYRRNVLGLHGDATNPLFVLHRLMAIVDDDETSSYNQEEYRHIRINDEMIRDRGGDIHSMLAFPPSHHDERFLYHWVGMDVGYTVAPSEILVFGEIRPDKKKPSVLQLLTRVHLERVDHAAQVEAIMAVIDHYRPKVFAMDSTGVGLPLYQDLQQRSVLSARVIRGYNFSAQILVGFDQTVEVDEWMGDPVKEAGIKRNVLEYAQDCLRDYVDGGRLCLPWDRNLIAQFQGGTSTVRAGHDQYGRKRIFSHGEDHALDGARMAVLGHVQYHIEELVNRDRTEPVLDAFVY